jgi:HAUS augmin-like complex subunit 1
MAEGFKFQSEFQSSLPTAEDDIEDTSNAAKISEVQAWLSSLFEASGKGIPEFDYTDSAVAHLHTVARVSQARTQAAQVIASDLWEKAAEYRTQAARFREISDGMGLASENLSQSALASINVLGTVANLLNIKDTETSSFLVGMADLLLRKTEVEEKKSKAEKESNTLLDNIRKAITHLTHLKRTVAELEEEAGRHEGIIQQRQNNLMIMDSKERQYLVQLANFKTILSRVGYTPEISHGVLIQMVKNRKELERKTKPVLNALRTYQDLPPDKALAELAIEDKRRECEAAEKYLEDVLHSALNTPSE